MIDRYIFFLIQPSQVFCYALEVPVVIVYDGPAANIEVQFGIRHNSRLCSSWKMHSVVGNRKSGFALLIYVMRRKRFTSMGSSSD